MDFAELDGSGGLKGLEGPVGQGVGGAGCVGQLGWGWGCVPGAACFSLGRERD